MGKAIEIQFKHQRRDFVGSDLKLQRHPISTVCLLILSDQNVSGIATCHHKDNFEYEIGRKLALKRAIEKANLDQETRTAIWSIYFARRF